MTAAPWIGLLIATEIPYRFLQVIFLDQLLEVGAKAAHYGNLLGGTANLTVASMLLAFWGRAVYARACRLAVMRGATPGRDALRVPIAALASYVLVASALTFAGFVTLFTVVGPILVTILAGVAAGTIELNERVSVTAPFRNVFRYASKATIPTALLFVLFSAMLVALANIVAAFKLSVWLATALGGFDAPHWTVLFSAGNRRFLLMLFAAAVVAIEPLWIAAHVVYVRKAGAEESGDDLRGWFGELRRMP